MKNIFKLLILVVNITLAQTIVPIQNKKITTEISGRTYYYKDSNNVLDKFLGSWNYQNYQQNPTKILNITFYKQEMVLTAMGYYIDEIYAKIKYVENGVTIYDSYQNSAIDVERVIFGTSFKYPNNTNKLNVCYYSEPGLGGKTGWLDLEYLAGTTPQLKWKVTSFRDADHLFKIPTVMTLTKVN